MIEFKASKHGPLGLCIVFTLSALLSSAALADDARCNLTIADKAANAKLSFDEFDQKGVTPATWRKLEEAGCHKQAIEAAEDYLVNGPVLTPNAKSDVLFHIAQSLAFDGDNPGAALMVAAAMSADHGSHDDLDWQAYLTGTWAYLVQNKSMLDAALAKMEGEPGHGNQIDADALRGLSRCFEKSYAEAYVACRPKSGGEVSVHKPRAK